MPPSKIRFVTACQQLLALGLVLAVLTPAASVISLDVVREHPSDAGAATTDGVSVEMSAYARATQQPSKVPAEVVDPTVDEYALTVPSTATARSRTAVAANTETLRTRSARTKADAVRAASEVTSVPQAVTGYGAVGVTWEHGVSVPDDQIAVQVRTRTGDTWSAWMDLDYHSEHAPDPGSDEAKHARPGTDPLLVGDVDQVQVQATVPSGDLPPDMKLAVIDPGHADRTTVEKPALDTSTMDEGTAPATTETGTDTAALPGTVDTDAGEGTDGSDKIALQAAVFTPKPVIYSRAQWGADEKMRQASSLHYFEVHAGFVHHTVNANDYTRAEVPAILRSIYAYHTKSRGWSDIGYNFLVDRFGRVWEGRYGGIDRPVVGAHTLNYNDYSFAMSAIGNYDIAQPSNAMIQAYGALFAWKLSLHGVDASSTKQWVGSKYFEAINGHRDAASTACPGRYLYAKLDQIRTLAAAAQRGWSGRELESDLASTANPDLVVRRASDGQAVVLPTGGLTAFSALSTVSSGWADGDSVVPSPDLTGDGVDDLLVRGSDGVARVRPGDGKGGFGAPTDRKIKALAGHDLITAVGDVNGDKRNDLVARQVATGRLDVYVSGKKGGFVVRKQTTGWNGYDQLAGAGDLNGDKRNDLVARDTKGALWLIPGTGTGTSAFGSRVALPGAWGRFSTITGYGDFTGDGRNDLFLRDATTGYGYVLPARGNGAYGHTLGPVGGFGKTGRVVGAVQVAGDGTPDVLVRTGDRLSVRTNRGTTEMRAPIATGVDLSNATAVFNAGDWDRDGHGDIIQRQKNGNLFLRRGDGAGHFGAPQKIGTGFQGVGLLAAVGDMTGDGYPDLMGQPKNMAIRIYPGAGTSGLKASYVAHGRISAGKQVAVGRWDKDGAPDSLFRKGSKLTLFPGNGPGGLTSNGKALSLDLTPYDWVVGISDIGLTGHPDLVVRERSTGYLWLIPGSTTGFGQRRFLAEGMEAYDLAG